MIHNHYQTLYDSCVAFGMRKALQAAKDKESMRKKARELDQECRNFQSEIEKLELQYDAILKNITETDEVELSKHIEDVNQKKVANSVSKSKLQEMLYNIKT